MATLKQIRGRIKAAKNIQQITRAMKLVAAARLRRATEKALAARPYSEKLRDVVTSLGSGGDLPSHPLMEKRSGDNYLLIMVTAERGLCGGYNTNLTRKATEFLKAQSGPGKVLAVGKKGAQFLGKRGMNVVHQHTVASSGATLQDAQHVARMAQEMFESGEVDQVFVCYSKFYSPVRQEPQVVQLLPIEPPKTDVAAKRVEYDFEPAADQLLNELIPRYFLGLVLQALLESTASEFGARMTAMTNATDNAGKMIQELTLKANRTRQAQITKEILEVVGGAEALNG